MRHGFVMSCFFKIAFKIQHCFMPLKCSYDEGTSAYKIQFVKVIIILILICYCTWDKRKCLTHRQESLKNFQVLSTVIANCWTMSLRL